MSTNGHIHWDVTEDSGLEVKLVQVTDDATLLRHWPWLAPRIALVRKKDKSMHERWTPEHVREAIRRGFSGQSPAKLWLGVNSENVIEGFMVTTVRYDSFAQLPAALVVWVLWANGSLIERCLPHLEDIARNHYLENLEFIGTRKAWIRKTPPGFKLKLMIFSKKVKTDAR